MREYSLAQEDLLASRGRTEIQMSVAVKWKHWQILQTQAMTLRTSQGSPSLWFCPKRPEKRLIRSSWGLPFPLRDPRHQHSRFILAPPGFILVSSFSKLSSVISPPQFSSQNPFNCSETLPAGFINPKVALVRPSSWNPCFIHPPGL